MQRTVRGNLCSRWTSFEQTADLCHNLPPLPWKDYRPAGCIVALGRLEATRQCTAMLGHRKPEAEVETS